MIKTQVDPIDRDIEVMVNELFSPAAQSAMLAEIAEGAIEEARDGNRQILGHQPNETITVDGREGASLKSVRPNGTIMAEFQLYDEMLTWITDQLNTHSPVGSGAEDLHAGLYRSSHRLYADGAEVPQDKPPPRADEYVFINLVPYARKLELGASSQAPDGVYQSVAVLAAQRFGNTASIQFSYRTAAEGVIVRGRVGDLSHTRQPAVIVRMR